MYPRQNHLGSPPRMWVVQTNKRTQHARGRITPTCVGSTLKDPSKIPISYSPLLEIYSLSSTTYKFHLLMTYSRLYGFV